MIASKWPVDRGPADRAAGRRSAAKGMLVARSSRRAAASRARGAVRIGGDLEAVISFALAPQRRPVEGLGQQHLLGEDQVAAVVVGHLVVVAHRDRVERARDLAVAAEDAA